VTPVNAPRVEIFKAEDFNSNVPTVLPMEVLAVPVVFKLIAPVAVNPCVAVNSPSIVTLSLAVAVVKVEVVLFLLQKPTVPSTLPVISPVQIKLPVAPSTVQPVSSCPPAKLMVVAVSSPGPMFKAEAEPAKFRVEALVLKRLTVPVTEVAKV
jgi:hypothetical protein